MKLTVSGQTKEYKEGLTVAELVVLENVRNSGICNSSSK